MWSPERDPGTVAQALGGLASASCVRSSHFLEARAVVYVLGGGEATTFASQVCRTPVAADEREARRLGGRCRLGSCSGSSWKSTAASSTTRHPSSSATGARTLISCSRDSASCDSRGVVLRESPHVVAIIAAALAHAQQERIGTLERRRGIPRSCSRERYAVSRSQTSSIVSVSRAISASASSARRSRLSALASSRSSEAFSSSVWRRT